MARTKVEKTPFAGDLNDPDGLGVWAKRFLEYERVRNYAAATVNTTEQHLKQFVEWAFDRGVYRPAEVTKPMLEAHQRWLFYFRKKNGRPLGYSTQRHRLTLIKGFFRWLTRSNVTLSNPASELEMPRVERRLPKAILNEREMTKVLAQPDLTEPLGVRDRAMMEVLYSTGVRRAELASLLLFDLDRERGTLTIRLGKNKTDRTVPIGDRAIQWVDRYLDEVRPRHVVPPDAGVIFLTEQGEKISLSHITETMRQYIEAAEVGKHGAVHIFRHSMATALLEGGADIRAIQEMLGHRKLETTEIYTRVSIKHLKAVHDVCHPTGKIAGEERAKSAAADANATPRTSEQAAELLAELEKEAGEDEPAAAAERAARARLEAR